MQSQSTGRSSYDSKGYSHFVLFLLVIAYMFNFLDRQLFVILQESIKAEMGFSDAQLGLMSGFAFAVLYVTFGVPIARWADRGNRRNIIAISLGVWSLMTAVCGMAQSFAQMLLARMGVAIGEAGGTPPALSMISDIYSEERRATAMAVYTAGMYIGLLVGFMLGGWIGQTYGWRAAFVAIGLPGVIFAVILRLVVKEPQRLAGDESRAKQHSFPETLRLLAANRTFVFIALAGGLASFASYGNGNWFPSYLLREFELSMAEVGLWMGLAAGFSGVVGTIGGGMLVDALGARDRRWYLWQPIIAITLSVGIGLVAITAKDPYLAIGLSAIAGIFTASWLPSVLALSHSLVGNSVRAQSSAILFLIINLIGMGMGPSAVGLMSDLVNIQGGGASLRAAMIAAGILGAVTSSICFYLATRRLDKDLSQSA